MRLLVSAMCSMVLWMGWARIAPGQEPATGTSPPVVAPVNPMDGATSTVTPAAVVGPREVYLPFKFLKGIFESQGASVVIPLDEYRRLKAASEKPPIEAAQVPAVISSSAYVATVEQDIARIRVDLVVNVLGKPWVEVPIRFGDAAVGQLIAGEKILLKGTGDGNYALLFGETGEQKLTIELTAKIHTSPEGREFAFDVPVVGITTFEIVIPEADQAVEVTPRLIGLPVQAAEKQTRFKANLGSTPRISARWRPKATSKPEMELLASVNNFTRVGIEDGLVHTDTLLVYEVLRGEVSQLRVAVPQDHRILDVSAESRLKGWIAKEEEGRQIVTIDLLGNQTGKFNVELHTERKIPEEAFDIAGMSDTATVGIHALDVVRESGQIGIFHSGDLALSVEQQTGVVRIDVADLHERLRGNGVTSFKYFAPKFTLKTAIKPVQPRVLVDQSSQLVFTDDELRLDTSLNYTIERAGLFQVQIKIPEGLTIDQVNCDGMKEFNADAASSTLTVSLNEKRMGTLTIAVRGHRDYTAGKDQTELVLPVLEPLGTEREIGSLHVFAKESIEVVTNEAGLSAAQPLPVVAASAIADTRATSSWSFTRRPVTIPVKTVRKPTSIEASVATTVHLQPELAEVKSQLDYVVQYAGVDTFRFLVPEAVSGRVQIEAVAVQGNSTEIKQQSPGEVQDGWIPWTIIMQREVLGTQRFSISYDLKPDAAAGEKLSLRKLDVQAIRPLGYEKGEVKTPLSQITGEMVITKDDSLAVSAQATGGDIEPIDVRELSLLPQSGTQAFRYFTQPDDKAITLAISQTKYEIEEVVATVVSQARVEIVTGETAEATYLAQLQLKTSERQRLLAHLPKGIKVLNVFVGDREVNLERAEIAEDQKLSGGLWESFWINVARDAASDQEFVITLHFQWGVNPSLGDSSYGRGQMELPMPVLGVRGSVPVQLLTAIVYVPEKFSLVGDPESFVKIDRVDPWNVLLSGDRRATTSEHGRIASAGTSVRLPTEGRVAYGYTNLGGATKIAVTWWNRVRMAFLFSGAAALVALLLLSTSVENKLSVLLVAAFAAVLYGLKDSQSLAAGLLAVRYGLAFLLGLWIVRAVFARKAMAATLVAAAAVTTTAPAGAAPAESGPVSTEQTATLSKEPEANGESTASPAENPPPPPPPETSSSDESRS